MIGRRGFITGLLASAAMPMLIDKHRVIIVGMDFGRKPAMVAVEFSDGKMYLCEFDHKFYPRIEDMPALRHMGGSIQM